MTTILSDKFKVTNLAPAISANRQLLMTKAMQSLNQLPPFSPVFSKLLASLSNEHVSVSELADWVEKDAIIAGQLLRTVNSAAYGRMGTINNLRHAVAILGLAKLRNFTLGLSVARIWTHVRTPKSWSTARFNTHSAAVAIMADQIAMHSAVEFGEGAFVSGLLHDIGRLVIALGLPEEYEALQSAHAVTDRPYQESEQEQLGFTHAELGCSVLQKWNVPPQIQKAVGDHHLGAKNWKGGHTLAWAIAVADDVVNTMGVSIIPAPQQPPPEAGLACLNDNGFQASSTKIIESFNVEFEVLRSIF